LTTPHGSVLLHAKFRSPNTAASIGDHWMLWNERTPPSSATAPTPHDDASTIISAVGGNTAASPKTCGPAVLSSEQPDLLATLDELLRDFLCGRARIANDKEIVNVAQHLHTFNHLKILRPLT
jgi:hypothetical protein